MGGYKDVAYAVSRVGSATVRSVRWAVETGLGILKYLNNTEALGLEFRAGEVPLRADGRMEREIEVFTDASFAPGGGVSHGCEVFMWGGCCILWSSSKQPFPALSTAEAELIALLEGVVMGESVGCIFEEIVGRQRRLLFCGNTAAISLASMKGGNWRTRHLKVRAAHLRWKLDSDHWKLEHRPGQVMVADIGTKPLKPTRLLDLTPLLGLTIVFLVAGRRPPATPATGHRPPATGYRPPATGHWPPATGHRPPATGHRPPATGHRPPATGHWPPAELRCCRCRPPAAGHAPNHKTSLFFLVGQASLLAKFYNLLCCSFPPACQPLLQGQLVGQASLLATPASSFFTKVERDLRFTATFRDMRQGNTVDVLHGQLVGQDHAQCLYVFQGSGSTIFRFTPTFRHIICESIAQRNSYTSHSHHQGNSVHVLQGQLVGHITTTT